MKTVLAYSGGLDTSICIRWLQEKYKTDVVTLTLEFGQQIDLKKIEEKARKLGVNPAIKANALYEGRYPVSTALSRPLISKYLVEIAEREKADAVAHGATGKGNDQVRFELAVRALNTGLEIIAPAREWDLTRDKAVEYAGKHGIPVSKSRYSVDENLWGRSIESGSLEDPMKKPENDVFKWTAAPENALDKPEEIRIDFKRGIPVGFNGVKLDGAELIQRLNKLGGSHGIGRIDMIEDRLVGIKSREVYECPAAVILLEAHRELERLTLTREENLFKEGIDRKWAQLVYFGQWHEPLREDLDAFIDRTQEMVSGEVVMELYRGNARVVGRGSPNSLYDLGLATYDRGDMFDHMLAEGFIRLWGLPSEIARKRRGFEIK
jgi:argininosuccinate synthase